MRIRLISTNCLAIKDLPAFVVIAAERTTCQRGLVRVQCCNLRGPRRRKSTMRYHAIFSSGLHGCYRFLYERCKSTETQVRYHSGAQAKRDHRSSTHSTTHQRSVAGGAASDIRLHMRWWPTKAGANTNHRERNLRRPTVLLSNASEKPVRKQICHKTKKNRGQN